MKTLKVVIDMVGFIIFILLEIPFLYITDKIINS
jgi:hypothetical protein